MRRRSSRSTIARRGADSIADLRVAHLPARTPYARKLTSATVSVANAAEDLPIDLTFAHVASVANARFDVLHIHRSELASEREIRQALDRCRTGRRGVVATVHDLSPCFRSRDEDFDRRNDLICSGASHVVTLTSGAADRIREQFPGRPWLERLTVIPHGRVVAPAAIGPRPMHTGPVRYGLFGALRPNRDIWTALVNWYYALRDEDASLTLLLRAFEPAVLRDPDLRVADILAFAEARHPRVRIVVLPQPTDLEVARFMADIDVLLLPYTSGSHSGQLELAFDAGVLPLASDVGFLREQAAQAAAYVRHQPVWFDWSDGVGWQYGRRFCEALLEAHALALAAPDWEPHPIDDWRRAQHEQIVEGHAGMYAAAVRSAR